MGSDIIERMSNKIEVPDSSLRSWETNYITIDTSATIGGEGEDVMMRRVMSLVEVAWQCPGMPISMCASMCGI